DLNATVKFYAIPPTGKRILLLTDSIPIGEDAAGGGAGLDGSRTSNLGGGPYRHGRFANLQSGWPADAVHVPPPAGVPREAPGERARIDREGHQVQGLLGRSLPSVLSRGQR